MAAMNCVFHPYNLASVRCRHCERGLCPGCDHRIKGHPYCQDCIVAGVEQLHRDRNGWRGPILQKSPGLAAVLALVPGLGAAYNGQIIKALTHFAIVAGLWQSVDLLERPFGLLPLMAGAAFYFYTIVDAKRAAERARAGEDLRAEDEQFKARLWERRMLWGGALIVLGALSFLNLAFDLQLPHLWPLLLFASGLYLLRGARRLVTGEPSPAQYHTPPPSVISNPYERATGKYLRLNRRKSD
jgi:hypothetical protein